jgi:hypothetical protein
VNLQITIVNKMNKFIQIILLSLFSLTMISCSPDDTETVTKPISKIGDVVSDVVSDVVDPVSDVVDDVGDVVEDTVEAANDVVVGDSSCSNTIPAPSLTASGSAGQVTLDWNEVACAISYTVFWDNSTGISYSSTSITGLSTNNYTHINLDNGSTYYYKVAAKDAANTSSELSSEVSAATPLPPPDNFSISGTSGTNTLTWSPVSGATGYTLYWDNVSGIDSSDTAITSISNENYTHSSLSDGTYYYKVAAVNSSGTGTLSSVGSSILASDIEGSETNDGHTYALTSSTMNWAAAASAAAAVGGYLSTINTREENDWLYDEFSNYGGKSRDLWIGSKDHVTEGTWYWYTGLTSTDGGVTDNISSGALWPDGTTKWYSNEPNDYGSGEDCNSLRGNIRYGKKWNDMSCTTNFYGIIEID